MASNRVHGHSRKILDKALKNDEPSLGRRIARSVLEHAVRDRNGQARLVWTEVFWGEDQQRMRVHRNLLAMIKKLGAYRDADGNVWATGKRLGCSAAVMYLRRERGEVMNEVSLFHSPNFMAKVPKEDLESFLKRIGKSIDQLPLFPEPRTSPVSLPLISQTHRVADSTEPAPMPGMKSPIAHHKKGPGRPESPRGRLCYEARMNGKKWQRQGFSRRMNDPYCGRSVNYFGASSEAASISMTSPAAPRSRTRQPSAQCAS